MTYLPIPLPILLLAIQTPRELTLTDFLNSTKSDKDRKAVWHAALHSADSN